MNYRVLKLILDGMSEEELDMTVTVNDPYEEELTAVVNVKWTDEDDAVDPGRPFLEMKA